MQLPEEVWRQAQAHGAVPYTAHHGQRYLVVCHAGALRVFVNCCPHRRLPLDSGGTVFFTADGRLLLCTNHGAKFDPLTGECVAGPCRGQHLQRVPVLEGGL